MNDSIAKFRYSLKSGINRLLSLKRTVILFSGWQEQENFPTTNESCNPCFQNQFWEYVGHCISWKRSCLVLRGYDRLVLRWRFQLAAQVSRLYSGQQKNICMDIILVTKSYHAILNLNNFLERTIQGRLEQLYSGVVRSSFYSTYAIHIPSSHDDPEILTPF